MILVSHAIGFFAASFGIRLAAKYPAEVFGHSPMYETLDAVLDLLDKPSDKVTELMKALDYKTISNYRFLLKVLEKNKVSMRTSWSSPDKKIKHSSLSLADINALLSILDTEEFNLVGNITMVGKLVAIDSERRTFKFRDSVDDEIYAGKLNENLSEAIFQVSRDEQAQVQVVLEESIEINATTQEENFVYILISFNYDITEKEDVSETPDDSPI